LNVETRNEIAAAVQAIIQHHTSDQSTPATLEVRLNAATSDCSTAPRVVSAQH